MQLDIPDAKVFNEILPIVVKAFELVAKQQALPFWMKKGEAAIYANVDPGTLRGYMKQGLKTTMKDGAERISKKAIDDFYRQHEF